MCLDARTGKRVWHFQTVHHGIWDYDLPAAPILADITVNGRRIKAVAQVSKQAFVYVLDRITGQPIWPIEERPVPQGNVPGEWYSPTQPFPTKPPAYARQAVTDDDLIDFTPELRKQALEQMKMYKNGPMFNPPIVSKEGGPIAALTIGTTGGGTNWPGGSFDPETNIAYLYAANSGIAPLGLVEPPAGFSDIRYVSGQAGQPFRIAEGPGFGSAADFPQPPSRSEQPAGAAPAAGRGEGAASPTQGAPAAPGGGRGGTTVQGLPLVKPPYSPISAIS